MKLLLFDIDGTLLSTDGAARRAFHRALQEVYETAGPIDEHPFAGKTDPQIARELLRLAGLRDSEIDRGLPVLWDRYIAGLEREIAADGGVKVFPGVRQLLDALEVAAGQCASGVLTGNIARGAGIKLNAAGIGGRFAFGAYGSDDERRNSLPEVALTRAREQTGHAFAAAAAAVIGDTPADVECGRSAGMRVAGVATGPYDAAALYAAGADMVWQDLTETERVVDWLIRAH